MTTRRQHLENPPPEDSYRRLYMNILNAKLKKWSTFYTHTKFSAEKWEVSWNLTRWEWWGWHGDDRDETGITLETTWGCYWGWRIIPTIPMLSLSLPCHPKSSVLSSCHPVAFYAVLLSSPNLLFHLQALIVIPKLKFHSNVVPNMTWDDWRGQGMTVDDTGQQGMTENNRGWLETTGKSSV